MVTGEPNMDLDLKALRLWPEPKFKRQMLNQLIIQAPLQSLFLIKNWFLWFRWLSTNIYKKTSLLLHLLFFIIMSCNFNISFVRVGSWVNWNEWYSEFSHRSHIYLLHARHWARCGSGEEMPSARQHCKSENGFILDRINFCCRKRIKCERIWKGAHHNRANALLRSAVGKLGCYF